MDHEMMYAFESMLDDPELQAMIAQLIGQLIALCVQVAVGLLTYILTAVGYYAIANRRGIRHAWLAWIPFGRDWLLGSISDQYQQTARGRTKGKRKVLLTLSILTAVSCVVFFAGLFSMIFMAVMDSMGYYVENSTLGLVTIGMLISMLAVLGLSIAQTVFYYMSLYDLYRAASPNNAVLFLVLGIFFPITTPFFVFFSRKKDDGMIPPRPVFNPYQQPVYRQPANQQPAIQQPAPQDPQQDQNYL